MRKKRFLLVFGSGVLTGLVLFSLFFVWYRFKEKEEVSEEEIATKTRMIFESPEFQKQTQKPSQEQVSGGLEWIMPKYTEEPKGPEISLPVDGPFVGEKPILAQESEVFADVFLEKFVSFVNPPVVSAPAITPIRVKKDWDLSMFPTMVPQIQAKNENNLPASTPPQLPKPIHPLTDEEWFKIAYPGYAINYYRVWEDFMKKQGFLPESEEIKLNSPEDVRVFVHRIIDFALKKGFITEAEAAVIRNANDVVLPNLEKMERRIEEGTFSRSGFGVFLSQLDDLLFDFSQKAWAIAEVTTPQCYRPGISLGSGTNKVAICCNCGWAYEGETVVYYYDCLQSNALCTTGSGLGCLNLVCMTGPTIFSAGICGCDPP